MSTSALIPSRLRGHRRVAAILAAAREVFAEHGFDGTTMSEIAIRSGTATGSLYRFFPSKTALADALLLDYAQRVMAALAALGADDDDMAPARLASGLVNVMAGLTSERAMAASLLAAQGGGTQQRVLFRGAMRQALVRILTQAMPHLTARRIRAVSAIVQHALAGPMPLEGDTPADEIATTAELRIVLTLYFERISPLNPSA